MLSTDLTLTHPTTAGTMNDKRESTKWPIIRKEKKDGRERKTQTNKEGEREGKREGKKKKKRDCLCVGRGGAQNF